MASPQLLNNIASLSRKVDKLIQKQEFLLAKIADLENINEKLVKQQQSDRLAINEANKQIEFLSLSHRLASSPEALKEARNKIAELIRTVDICIRMMNED